MNNVQTNTQQQAAAVAAAKIEKQIVRAANSKTGKHVILSKEDAETIYNNESFNPRGEFKGWMHKETPKTGRVQVAMDIRKDGKIVIWAM